MSVSGSKFSNLKAECFKDSHWEYLEVYDASTLEQATADSQEIYIGGAYKSRAARLIDNSVFPVAHV